ncbi:hypothetical protein AWB91_12430 [Mycobacterium paraense]|uniref:Uncharacterized protein n=1 Tax=Mycobacterium paraense TaxID=767916 RepID=A0ABX3VR00_9MYCO|nr:hypothetical protein [Mycobacterium paraense]ORW32256.1 hypothetical protein AWB91_12430 [Mycobacterium paraense]ORW35240.1 hypothetical protein AWB88_27140 [Mycobacterium paraense]
MTNIDPELSATLDAEYRELVRSLHRETIDIIVEFQEWWDGVRIEDDGTVVRGAFSVAVFLMSRESAEDLNEEDQRAAKIAEARWRDTIHPRLSILINGHPDPDVREAADVLNKRSFEPIMMLNGTPRSDEVNGLAIKLIHDGLTALRRAAYYAPFRIHRPEPDWDGVPTGNAEGLPGDILKRMQERGEHWKG